ncbi:hypothetical protein BDR07DRAFT_1438744 [Suillus spraguei]|nr:hypothetical protein BDR07DRAFT_1438744 [Suillus spraguei]
MPGKAEIDEEFTSRENDKFVLHDSQGFEAADKVNLEIVQKFIERRRNMPTQKDQLHAIGGRLLERGTEEFLTLKSNGTLGNIPIVVVFTKYDKLVDELQDICIRPLKEFAGLIMYQYFDRFMRASEA